MELDETQCFLDFSFSSKLLSTKIADIPSKLKYETILAPLYEYCFGTSDQNYLLKYNNDHDEQEDNSPQDNDSNNNLSLINLQIDWIRDKTFIYNQIFLYLEEEKLNILARKLRLWENRQFLLDLLIHSPTIIPDRYFEQFKNDREMVMEAVKQNGDVYLFKAGDELKNDFEIVKCAVQQSGYAFQHISSKELRNNKEIVMLAVRNVGSVLGYASKEFRDDKEIVQIALQSNIPLEFAHISERLKRDRDIFVMSAKNNAYETLKFACPEFKNDIEIVMQAMQQDPNAFEFASRELKNNRDFVKEIVTRYGECLKFVESFKDDKEIVELALKSSPDAIHSISNRLRGDTEFISKLIRKRGFKLLPEEFYHDREIVLESIKLDSFNFYIAGEEFQNDREFILQVVKMDMLQYIPDCFSNDKEIMLKAARTNSSNYHALSAVYDNLSEDLKNDRELLMQWSEIFDHFPRKYQLDIEMAMECAKAHPQIVLYSVYALVARERALAMRIVKKDGLLLQDLPSKHRNDREIVSFAIQQNKKALTFASEDLQSDLEILKLLNDC